MNTVIKLIDTVPSNLMELALLEITSVDWENPPLPDFRRMVPMFATSYSTHLRIHEKPSGKIKPIEEISKLVECQDTFLRTQLANTNNLVNWIYDRVSGEKLGRIMLVNLLAGGVVPNHIDKGPYFETYKRFHIPLITNEDVVFTGSKDGLSYHMPTGVLGILNNSDIHGIRNNSTNNRIHLIVDIATNITEFQF